MSSIELLPEDCDRRTLLHGSSDHRKLHQKAEPFALKKQVRNNIFPKKMASDNNLQQYEIKNLKIAA